MFLVVSLFVIGTVRANVVYNEEQTDNQTATDVHLEYVLLNEDNPCARTCIEGASPMICRYHFKIEWYHTLSKACYDCPFNTSDCFRQDCVPGDGYKRAVVTVNRQIPGPTIEVCQGDIIVADVTNMLGSEGTTIHWHGQHQKNTPYMDGVPYVTQCPILPHDTFRYTFKAIQAGTHFWHSHIGMQRADGAFGAFIVRVPEEQDPHFQFYDYDLAAHVITVLDWEKETGLEKFLAHHHNDADNKPTTLLVNGLGRFVEFDDGSNSTVYIPTARFKVEQGYRYRFRVINAGFLNCPIEISVDNHTIKVISTDGSDVAPTDATSLVTYAGERFDFVLNADQDKALYWIRFRGLMDCDERFKRAHQVAVLEYGGLNTTMDDYPEGVTDYDTSHRDGTQINALNRGVESNSTYISMPQLESLEKWDTSLKSTPDIQYYIAYDFYKLNNPHFHKAPYYGFNNISDVNLRLLTPQFNHISMKTPPFPLLPQRNEITKDMFCNKDTMKDIDCVENYCECPHGLNVPLDAVVELIFVDEGFAYDANHPLHIHGYNFRIVAMERLGKNVTVEEVQRRDRQGLIKRNLLDAPLKDTVTVPDGGYTIVRFVASNPGYWIFHCHIEFHTEIGMALVLKVGEDHDMLPVPQNFPRCGDYLPELTHCEGDNCDNKCKDCNNAPVIKTVSLYIIVSLLASIHLS
uniref:Laccase I n=1 Tax=Monochamus alternatus TaxID=192382 RepID=A0A291KZC6_MONAT|nr:laccase I [Monochamus alternatus]